MSSVFYEEILSLITSLIGISLIFTFVFSVMLMIIGRGLFFKLGRKPNNAFIPVYNLVVLVESLEMKTFLTILFFVPFINLGFFIYISYKLGYVFKQDFGFTLGLIFLPIVFYYVLGNGKGQLTIFDEAKEAKLKKEILNDSLLLTDEDLKNANNAESEPTNSVDSIFKSRVELMPEAPTYKAQNVIDLPELDFDKLDGKHKIIFIPSPRGKDFSESMIKKVETSYLEPDGKAVMRHEDEINVYEIK